MTHLPDALVEVLAHLDASSDYCRFVAGAPVGDGWLPGADVVDGAVLARWVADGVDRRGPKAAGVVGSFLASWIADIVAVPVVAAIQHSQRAWPVDLASLAVHRDEEGWFNGLAVLSGPVRVVRGDPAAGMVGVEVVDNVDSLVAITAAEIAAAVAPVFAEVRRLAPFGVRGMWGNLADAFSSEVVWAAQRRGADTADAFADARRFTDAVATAAGVAIVRPTPLTVQWSGGPTVVSCKGTCCLLYKLVPDARPDGDGYCTSCPKREATSQHTAMAAWLEELTAAAGN